jgi:hypothetical protein
VQSGILSGWKDIANYLGKGVRTVQRYELELGLPVRRPSGKAKGSVIATQSEIDAWVAACRLSERSHTSPSSSTLSAYGVLADRIAEMDKLSEQMARLRVEIRDSRDMLRATIQRIQEAMNPERRDGKREHSLRLPGKRLG